MSEYWWLYLAFIGFVALMLALDLGVFHKDAHEVSFKEAATWSVAWVSLALIFNYGFYQYALWKFPMDPRLAQIPDFNAIASAERVALEFLTGFVVEKSLAVDNIFVFVIVFAFFGIPAKYQHRVLFWGIIGAVFFRAIFIGVGSVLMQYKAIVIFFGALLILTGIKIFFAPQKPIDPGKNPLIKWLKRSLPVTDKIHGDKFFIKQDGKRYITPLFLALIFIELSDIIFAIDSVPAIFALSSEPLIVFTSNIFAILGLRAMYFLLAGVVDKFYLLKYALGVVLVFVGLKMAWLNQAFGGKFPISWSLIIITTIIGTGIAASLLRKKPESVLPA
ncbi:TerC/Alx family metal homeostasis membrane protein [bacterium]|nr:TerC/Alx family metal homeostasis membrane protein [bacterium]